MTDSDNQKITEIHVAMFGVQGTESKGLVGAVNELASKIAILPCEESQRSLTHLQSWQAGHDRALNEEAKIRKQYKITLGTGFILILASAVVTNLVTLLFLGLR